MSADMGQGTQTHDQTDAVPVVAESPLPGAAGPHVLIIVQNLPVPLDRRVWLECKALTNRGYTVSVICPKGPDDPAYEELEGVHLYKYRPAPEAEGVVGYAWEFGYSWIRTVVLSGKVWRRQRFDVLQSCNPPDTYWLLAQLWRPLRVRFVFDHHDLNVELFVSRFGEATGAGRKLQYRGLEWLERRTLRSADRVISTNDSYRAVAIERGHRRPWEVTVVRSGPDTEQMRPIYPTKPRRADQIRLVYLGIMGPQDCVDQVLLVMDELVNRRGRTDISATLMGFGDCLADLKVQSTALGLDPYVTFTGRVDKLEIAEHLSGADIGLGPDLRTPLNDLSTMNKTMEYMTYGLPSVAYDLAETRISGGDAVSYVPSGDVRSFADAVEKLADDHMLRRQMGRSARTRAVAALDWRPSAEAYVQVFDELTGFGRPGPAVPVSSVLPDRDSLGRQFVGLDDPDEFDRYLSDRCAPTPDSLNTDSRRRAGNS